MSHTVQDRPAATPRLLTTLQSALGRVPAGRLAASLAGLCLSVLSGCCCGPCGPMAACGQVACCEPMHGSYSACLPGGPMIGPPSSFGMDVSPACASPAFAMSGCGAPVSCGCVVPGPMGGCEAPLMSDCGAPMMSDCGAPMMTDCGAPMGPCDCAMATASCDGYGVGCGCGSGRRCTGFPMVRGMMRRMKAGMCAGMSACFAPSCPPYVMDPYQPSYYCSDTMAGYHTAPAGYVESAPYGEAVHSGPVYSSVPPADTQVHAPSYAAPEYYGPTTPQQVTPQQSVPQQSVPQPNEVPDDMEAPMPPTEPLEDATTYYRGRQPRRTASRPGDVRRVVYETPQSGYRVPGPPEELPILPPPPAPPEESRPAVHPSWQPPRW